jgi:hypothetical protein
MLLAVIPMIFTLVMVLLKFKRENNDDSDCSDAFVSFDAIDMGTF